MTPPWFSLSDAAAAMRRLASTTSVLHFSGRPISSRPDTRLRTLTSGSSSRLMKVAADSAVVGPGTRDRSGQAPSKTRASGSQGQVSAFATAATMAGSFVVAASPLASTTPAGEAEALGAALGEGCLVSQAAATTANDARKVRRDLCMSDL